MMKCGDCGAIEGTPHDLNCPVRASGKTAKALLRRAIGHLRRAEGLALLGSWEKMQGAVTDAHIAMAEAREVADEARDVANAELLSMEVCDDA